MNAFSDALFYEFQARELSQTEALKQYADHVAREIKDAFGWDAAVQIHVEPVVLDKKLFSVSISTQGFSGSIHVRKEGKYPLSVLRKVRKSVLRQIHRLNEKRMTGRKNRWLKEKYAS